MFLSHAREDRRVAARLVYVLAAGGRSVWWDREILPGRDFARLIGSALGQARAVVVIWSPASSCSGWVRDEAQEALRRGVLVPVLFNIDEPPIGYRSVHSVDLTGWKAGRHPGLADLDLAIGELCA